MEAQSEEKLADLVELEAMVEKWEERAGKRAKRVAMSAVVSFPSDVDEEQATEAARQFFHEAFADNHDYVFAAHTDAKQFHVHLVLETRGHNGRQLRLDRDDIQDLRLLLAEKARAQGIALDASPRWARGEAAEERRPRAVEGIERRGGTPAWTPTRELWRKDVTPAGRAALEALNEERATRRRAPEAGACQALEYARAAGSADRRDPHAGDRQREGGGGAGGGAVGRVRVGVEPPEQRQGGGYRGGAGGH